MPDVIENEPLRQLFATGYFAYVKTAYTSAGTVYGEVDLALIPLLRNDARFKAGGLHHLHTDVGDDRVEFRGLRRQFGEGSLQIVICREDGQFYCDVDAFSPYDDVVSFGGHSGEVLHHWGRKLTSPFRKLATLVRWLKSDPQTRDQ